MGVTLEQVAERAGVSRGAASLILREHPKAKSFQGSTVQRVRDAAEALGYRPNFFQARRNRARMLMCYVATLQDLYAAGVAEAIQRRAAERGYWVIVHAGASETAGELFDERIIGRHGISAIALIGGVCERVRERELTSLVRGGVRPVAVGRDLRASGVSRILVDNAHGGRLIGEHLIELGVRRAALITSHKSRSREAPSSRPQRDEGLREAFAPTSRRWLREIHPPTDQPREPEGIGEEAYRATRDHLRRLPRSQSRPEAIVAQADLRAMGVYRALDEAGLKPGRDVAVVGYTDIWPARMLAPPLTTVREPIEEMGHAAADLLIDFVEGAASHPRCVHLNPVLQPRGSTLDWRPSNPRTAT